MNTEDIVLYNTEETIKVAPTAEKVETFDLVPPDHPALYKVLPEFDFENAPINPNSFASTLVETCRKHNGIGLSANQCGVFERVFVIGTDHFQIACINPRIIGKAPSTIKESEGCLSYPGLYVKIDRPDWVDVEFIDETGTLKQMRLEGITARCFQHELDHMNGIRMVDHVGPVALQMARKKQEKVIKKIIRHKKK